MDEELAVGHVRDDEVASSVRRGLRESASPESNRVLERLVVGFGRVRRGVDGAGRHPRRGVDRGDGNEMDRCAGHRMARVRRGTANSHGASGTHNLPSELVGLARRLTGGSTVPRRGGDSNGPHRQPTSTALLSNSSWLLPIRVRPSLFLDVQAHLQPAVQTVVVCGHTVLELVVDANPRVSPDSSSGSPR